MVSANVMRPVTGVLRVWLVVVGALLLGVSLSLLSPPLTAAFLGAGYAARCVLQLLAAREQMWTHTRMAPIGGLLCTA